MKQIIFQNKPAIIVGRKLYIGEDYEILRILFRYL